jgi:hypothetical protein
MGLYKYDKVCSLLELYTDDNALDYARQIERCLHALNGKQHIVLYSGADFEDDDTVIASIAICERDQRVILVIIDDCGHAHVIQDKSDVVQMYGDDGNELFIGIPNEFNEKLNKVFAKYKTRGSVDYFEMAIRLVELGDV